MSHSDTPSRIVSLEQLVRRPPRGPHRYIEVTQPGSPDEVRASPEIPGAMVLTMDDFVGSETPTSGRRPLPDHSAFVGRLLNSGIRPGQTLFVYPRTPDDVPAAARCWVTLLWAGTDARFVDLSGPHRLPAVAENLSSASDASRSGQGSVTTAGPTVNPGIVRTLTEVEHSSDATLFDARGERAFASGDDHIPGAVPLDARDLYVDGVLLTPSQIRDRVAAATGSIPADPTSTSRHPGHDVILYCGGGIAASMEAVAFEYAGLPWSVYAGSWSEWSKHRHPVGERNGAANGS